MAFQVSSVTPQELHSRLNNEGCQVVDVREREEFSKLRLAGSISMPLSALSLRQRLLDRSRTVYLVCKSGKRAEMAACELARAGFADLRVVAGGLDAWTQCGYSLRSASTKPGTRGWLFCSGAILLPAGLASPEPFTGSLTALIGIALVQMSSRPALGLSSRKAGPGLWRAAIAAEHGKQSSLAAGAPACHLGKRQDLV